MYKIQLLINDQVIDEHDTDKEYYSFLPNIDIDNPTLKFTLKIKNLIDSSSTIYPKTLILKSNLSPSFLISSGPKANIKVFLNDNYIGTFSSDKFSLYTEDYIGIIFSEDLRVINNFGLNNILQDKFILVPYTIKPQQEIVLDFVVNYLDFESSENFSRSKLINLFDLLYSSSKKFVRTLEVSFNKDLSKFYKSYNLGNVFFIISPISIQTSKWSTKDLSLFHLVANGIFKHLDGTFNEFLLNYEFNILSNLIISTTSAGPIPTFSTEIIETDDSLITSNNLDIKFTTAYLNDLFYLIIYEILKPYITNSNYIPTNIESNVDKISKLLHSLLNIGFKQNEIKIYIDQSAGTFGGESLNEYDKKKYATILYLISLMFIEFVRKLEERNILYNMPTNASVLENFLLENIDLFLESSNYVNSLNKLDMIYELDYILTLLFALLIYSYEGKYLFKNFNKLFIYFSSIFNYFSNVSKFISEHFTKIDPNTELLTDFNVNITSLLNQIFIIGFLNSISTHNLLKINLSDYFNISNNVVEFDYLTNKATITISSSDFSYIHKRALNIIRDPYIFIFPNVGTEITNVENAIKVIIDLNYFDILINNNSSVFMIPKLSTKVHYLNYLNAYLKLLASKINNIYYFTKDASNEETAIIGTNTYAYLNYILLLMLNNKETQNNINIKFSLQNV